MGASGRCVCLRFTRGCSISWLSSVSILAKHFPQISSSQYLGMTSGWDQCFHKHQICCSCLLEVLLKEFLEHPLWGKVPQWQQQIHHMKWTVFGWTFFLKRQFPTPDDSSKEEAFLPENSSFIWVRPSMASSNAWKSLLPFLVHTEIALFSENLERKL